eukprot:tig00000681_g3066.t1
MGQGGLIAYFIPTGHGRSRIIAPHPLPPQPRPLHPPDIFQVLQRLEAVMKEVGASSLPVRSRTPLPALVRASPRPRPPPLTTPRAAPQPRGPRGTGAGGLALAVALAQAPGRHKGPLRYGSSAGGAGRTRAPAAGASDLLDLFEWGGPGGGAPPLADAAATGGLAGPLERPLGRGDDFFADFSKLPAPAPSSYPRPPPRPRAVPGPLPPASLDWGAFAVPFQAGPGQRAAQLQQLQMLNAQQQPMAARASPLMGQPAMMMAQQQQQAQAQARMSPMAMAGPPGMLGGPPPPARRPAAVLPAAADGHDGRRLPHALPGPSPSPAPSPSGTAGGEPRPSTGRGEPGRAAPVAAEPAQLQVDPRS